MPLSVDEHREYMREYMRKKRAVARQAGSLVLEALGKKRGQRLSRVNPEAGDVARHALSLTLETHGETFNHHVGELVELSKATRTKEVCGVAITERDNDACLRARLAPNGLGDLHERAGHVLSAQKAAPQVASRCRMFRINSDGSEEVIEVVTG